MLKLCSSVCILLLIFFALTSLQAAAFQAQEAKDEEAKEKPAETIKDGGKTIGKGAAEGGQE